MTQVVAPGEYSFRGGLIDLYPMGSAVPYRIDLFDDEIESIRSFDVDGDGDQDFVIGNQGDSLDIYLGDGNGNFATARHFDNLPGVCDINAGDFNGDGDLDIVFGGTDGVYLMIANP